VAGPIHPPAFLRPAALALMAVAVLLASCSGDEPAAAPSRGSPSPVATTGSTTAPPTTPSKPPKSPKPTSKPPKQQPPPKPKPFHLRLESVHHSAASRKLRPAKLRRATFRPARAIQQRFEGLFKATYIDPAAWRKARYGPAIERYFGGQVRPVARAHLSKLTLGPFAGKEFESVREPGGRIKVNVLVGAGGTPVTASVRATFTMKAVRANGGTTVIVSDGFYYVRPSKGGWVIDAFRVGRHDHRV